MTENASEGWVDGSYESGSDPVGQTGDGAEQGGGADAPGAEIGQGAASTFEPEEDGPVDAEPT